jgi:hypothetical protein
MATDIPATAPDDRPFFPLSSLLLLLLLSLLLDSFEGSDVAVVSELEAVVPAVMAVLSPVDSGGWVH